jgi:hypothetical protein
MRWTGHVAHMGEERCVYRVLVGRITLRWTIFPYYNQRLQFMFFIS